MQRWVDLSKPPWTVSSRVVRVKEIVMNKWKMLPKKQTQTELHSQVWHLLYKIWICCNRRVGGANTIVCFMCRNARQQSNEAIQTPKALNYKASFSEIKPVDFFDRKKHELDLQRQVLKATTSANLAATRASYLVVHRIAKAKSSSQ